MCSCRKVATTKIDLYKITRSCSKCEHGELISDDIRVARDDNVLLFRHHCDSCGYVEDLTTEYPHIKYFNSVTYEQIYNYLGFMLVVQVVISVLITILLNT